MSDDSRFSFDMESLAIAIVIVAFVVVSYLNGHDHRQQKIEQYRACARTEQVARCIKDVDK